MDYGLNWKSLTQPAILPLTTDYVPPIKLMDRSYDVNNVYQLLVDKQESPFLTSEDLMQELICLRLTQVTLICSFGDCSAKLIPSLNAPSMCVCNRC
ncbi:MAG: hypothetical protein B7Z23_12515 [Pseudomonadales bacterium 32-61-5]|nr:MAG: hypothetical protein B7Z23_12515 [Pseudomonadales bacterium 32-61-5]